MSQVVRFVDIDFINKNVSIKEAFLGFMQLHSKDATSIEELIIHRLESDKLSLADCRSQCYDNAAVMSGHISGVQKRILDRNPRALFVNCDNHSLNLAGVHCASQEPVIVTFFANIETLYVFFSRSTLRWEKMKQTIPLTVKRESETRWSARFEAVKAIHDGLDDLVSLLEQLSEDQNETTQTRGEAGQILQSVLTFNFLTLLPYWYDVLEKINRVQKRLQDPNMNFQEASRDIEALQANIFQTRDKLCQNSVAQGKQRCEAWGVEVQRRIRRRRKMAGELTRDEGLSAEEEILRVMKSVLDRLQQEMIQRFTRLKELSNRFGFLLDVRNLLENTNTADLSLRKNCTTLGDFYDTDLDGAELYTEICDCIMLLATRHDNVPKTPLELLSFIVSYGEDVFPNLRVALQILLTISVSIASCERSFSKLKLILTYMRTSMNQNRLSDLALLSIEKETLNRMSFDKVIDQFAAMKARKVPLR